MTFDPLKVIGPGPFIADAQTLDRVVETQMSAMRATLNRQAVEIQRLQAEALAPNGHPWKALHEEVCALLKLMTSDRDEQREEVDKLKARIRKLTRKPTQLPTRGRADQLLPKRRR